MDSKPAHKPNLIIILTGVAGVGLGLLVLLGWYAHSVLLVQVNPAWVPMQYNTALSLVFCGAGLLAVAFGRPRLALIGGIPVVVGILTLIQYLFYVDLHIDQFLVKPFTTVESAYPGRMSINTTICIVLAGTSLMVMSRRVLSRPPLLLLGLLGAVISAQGIIAFLGYLIGLRLPIILGSRMAVHTAAGFVVLGVGIIAFAWRYGWAKETRTVRWLPLIVGMGGLTIVVGLWQALTAREQARIGRIVGLEKSFLREEIKEHMEIWSFDLVRMAEHWTVQSRPLKEEWECDLDIYIEHREHFQSLNWTDSSFHVRWTVPFEGNEQIQDFNLGLDEGRRTSLEAGRDRREVTFICSKDLVRNGEGFEIYAPVYAGKEFDGFILGVIRSKDLLDSVFEEHPTHARFSMAVFEAGEEIYGRYDPGRQFESDLGQDMEILFHGAVLRVRVWPGPELMAEEWSYLPEAVLIGGLLISLILALTVYFAQSARIRARVVEAANRNLRDEISARRQVEEAQTRLLAAVEQTADIIMITDTDGIIAYVNSAFEHATGYRREEVIGQTPRILKSGKHEAPFYRTLWDILKRGEA